MEYIKNCRVDLDFSHVFCKFSDIPDSIMAKLGKGKMVFIPMVGMSYIAYKYNGFTIFPE